MNAAEVKTLLVARTEEVCALLLPNGKRRGAEWLCGSVSGEAGESLKIHLSGTKAGLWADFSGSEKGDLFALWMACKGMDFVAAIKDVKAWLGVAETNSEDFAKPRAQPKRFVRPALDVMEPLQSGGQVFDYLTKTRGLYPEILHAYGVGQMVSSKSGATIVFPTYEPSGKAIDMLKFLAVERDVTGKKKSWSSAESRDHLIGWQTVTQNDREIAITEGEIDAYTVAGWGMRALSIPRGVKAMDWIEHDYEALERFEKIYLCTDMDAEGNKCAEEIAARLGRTRCYRVRLLAPYKDANEAHTKGFLGPDFFECVDAAKTLDPSALRSVGDFSDEAWEALHPTDQRALGTEPPIPMPWRCRFGEVSLWCGINGHGKSQMLLQFALHDASQGERVCVASLEMPAAKVTSQLVRMALGMMPRIDQRTEADAAVTWLAESFWIVDRVGVMYWRELLPVLEYSAKRYGCTRFVIDSLVRCGIGEDDYDQQKAFVGALTDFAGRFGHVHVVAHPRKGVDELKAPGKMDVRGSGTLADLVHNGFTVWRNKEKEQKLEAAAPDDFSARIRYEAWKDGQISIWKQREGGDEPARSIWLHKPSGQFLSSADAGPKRYVA